MKTTVMVLKTSHMFLTSSMFSTNKKHNNLEGKNKFTETNLDTGKNGVKYIL